MDCQLKYEHNNAEVWVSSMNINDINLIEWHDRVANITGHKSNLSRNHYSAVCLTKGPQPLPKRMLHRVRSSASSLIFQHHLVSLRSSNSCSCLLPYLSVTFAPLSIFPSIMCVGRQSIRKVWPIQLVLILCIIYMIFQSSLTIITQ